MENSLELKMSGVQELGRKEMKEVEGGGGVFAALALGLLVGAAIEVITEGSAQCWKDFKEGYDSTRNN